MTDTSITRNASTLRPGLLVSLKTSVTGNVQYDRVDLDSEVDGKTSTARWETVRTITDAEEHERATKARNKAASLIRSVCAKSEFGLLCPDNASTDLDAAIVQARAVTNAFNESARLSRVRVYVIIGKVAATDQEAVAAINSEISDLLAEMERGIESFDVKAIREAASKAKNVGQMLSPDAQAQVQIAIDVARAAARKIVKVGEAASQEIDQSAIRKIAESRTVFLDFDETKPVSELAPEGRELDFGPDLTDEQFAAVEEEHANKVNGDYRAAETDGTEDYNEKARREEAIAARAATPKLEID